MSAARSGKDVQEPNILRCARYNSAGRIACSGHIIRWNHLVQVVLTDIQSNVQAAVQDEKAFLQKLQAYLSESDRKRFANEEKWEKGMPEPIFQKMLTRYT